jgi:hypothetical protein
MRRAGKKAKPSVAGPKGENMQQQQQQRQERSRQSMVVEKGRVEP